VGGWNGRTIPQGPHFRAARAAHGPIDHDVSTFVLLDGQAGHDRVGDDPRYQDDATCFNRFPLTPTPPPRGGGEGRGGKMDLARLDGPHTGVGPDLRPTSLAQYPGSISREFRVHFRHDAVSALE